MSDLFQNYKSRYDNYLIELSKRLELYINEICEDLPRIDRISGRAKSPEKFLEKSEKRNVSGENLYDDPLNQIQDQIGVRIIAFYLDDVVSVSDHIKEYLAPIEEKRLVPDSEKEFGYEGKHYIFFIPDDLFDKKIHKDKVLPFFELQIKTLYQHAWSESNHDLGYKPDRVLSKDEKRKIAFTAAQSWGADQIFNELFTKPNN